MTALGQQSPQPATDAATFVPDDGSDVVVFSAATRQLHRLDHSAATIWAAIDGLHTVDDIVVLVAEVHRTTPTSIAADVAAALAHLTEIGLVHQPRRSAPIA